MLHLRKGDVMMRAGRGRALFDGHTWVISTQLFDEIVFGGVYARSPIKKTLGSGQCVGKNIIIVTHKSLPRLSFLLVVCFLQLCDYIIQN